MSPTRYNGEMPPICNTCGGTTHDSYRCVRRDCMTKIACGFQREAELLKIELRAAPEELSFSARARRFMLDFLLYLAAFAGLFGLWLLWFIEAGRPYP